MPDSFSIRLHDWVYLTYMTLNFRGIVMTNRCLLCACFLAFALAYWQSADGDIPRNEDGFNFLCDSVLGDVGYVFSVNDDTLEKSTWADVDCPRCTPKRAKELAKEWINKNTDVKDKDNFEWVCKSIRLVHAYGDVWFWVVDCKYRIKIGGSTGIPATFSVAVLTDGTIPPVKKVKPQE